MTPEQFVIWLRGFTEGVHEFNVSPKQWDILKDKLAEVKDKPTPSFPFGTPNTQPIWQQPHYQNPLENPYKVTCETEKADIKTMYDSGTSVGITGSTGIISSRGGTQVIVTDGFIQNSSYTRESPPNSTLTYTTNKGVIYTLDKDK